MLLKIDRVCSPEEVRELVRLGASHICASLHSDDRLVGGRTVDIATARSLRAEADNARFGVQLPDDITAQSVGEIVRQCNCDFVQLPPHVAVGPAVADKLQQHSVELFVAPIEVSHDDDPGWLLPDSETLTSVGVACSYQLELLADRDDAWHFLQHESPRYPDEIQIADINSLAGDHSLFVSLDITVENIDEIGSAFSRASGLAFTLGALKEERYGIHVYDLAGLAKILRHLAEGSPKRLTVHKTRFGG